MLIHQVIKTTFWSTCDKKQEAYKKFIEVSRNNYYTTRNVLDFSYHQNCYKRKFIKTKKYEYSSKK